MPDYLYAFISHAHADNALCDPLATALAQVGVPHYYDRANPQIGHDIGEALERAMQRARALIVLATPTSLASPWVREEISIFFTLMMRDTTRMLIPVKVAPCDLPARLEARWWVDAVGRPASEVATELARALEQRAAPSSIQPTQPGGYSRVVDWRQSMGDHTTIADAITAARPGERIFVRKGIYEGCLVIDKPLEIVGDGQPGDVEVRASGASAIHFMATQGRVANLTLRQMGGGAWFGVDIDEGRLELKDCDISSESRACMAVHGRADPRVLRCCIHDGNAGGVYVYDQGQGLFEDCDIFANTLAGMAVKTGGSPTVRRCRIHDGKSGGVYVYEQGRGLFEECDIFANAHAGAAVVAGGSATVRKCRINKNGHAAISVGCESGGVFEQNDLRDNTWGAWDIASDSAAKVIRRDNIE